MAWKALRPKETSRERAARAPATISCREPNKDGTQSVVIVLREGPEWFKRGASVGVEVGTDEDAGKLAIVPDGPFPVVATPPNPKVDKQTGLGAQVIVPLFDGATIERREREAVEFKVEGRRIILTLPAWARRKESGPVVVPASPAPTGRPTPFRGIGSTAPDPLLNEDMALRRIGAQR